MKEQLAALAKDFWWTGDPWANDIWKELEPHLWEKLLHNPIAVLQEIDWDAVSDEWKTKAEGLLNRYEKFKAKEAVPSPKIAYFCMEFGIHESFPIYSGGLGILAGDHIRSAGDLKLDFTGIGLFYKHGYFSQLIRGGRQAAGWPNYKNQLLPMSLVLGKDQQPLLIGVPYCGGTVEAQVWLVQVGGAKLYLLDTDLAQNSADQRDLTSNLYGGDLRTRIGQEILLGIGGVRLLEALGEETEVFHLNEGHAAFLILELWIRGVQTGLSAEESWLSVQKKCVFTTHTPVPAGHDKFYWHLVNEFLGSYREQSGFSKGSFMSTGRENIHDISTPLSMTVLALKGSRKANGVSKLHGEVSREMFATLGYPIGHITNGVHPTAWLAPELADVFEQYLPGWNENWNNSSFWAGVSAIPDDVLWDTRRLLREKLIRCARYILRQDVLDPEKLTIGFARRFATYKRGALIFSDPDRLEKLLNSGVQLVFAGKAHPADHPGQDILATVLRFARDPRFRGQVVFIPDYNAHIGRMMTQGCDVWLNNPRRPREASGTSGQKVSLNGGLNFSSIDGWWPEAFDGTNGWGIGDSEDWEDLKAQDDFDVESLYQTLENEIIPTFKNKAKWVQMMRRALETCCPVYNTERMVMDYLKQVYES